MERNQTNVHRIARIAGGLFVLSLSMVGPQAIWGLLGIIPLVTGLTGFDPLYGVLQYRTWPLAPITPLVAKGVPR